MANITNFDFPKFQLSSDPNSPLSLPLNKPNHLEELEMPSTLPQCVLDVANVMESHYGPSDKKDWGISHVFCNDLGHTGSVSQWSSSFKFHVSFSNRYKGYCYLLWVKHVSSTGSCRRAVFLFSTRDQFLDSLQYIEESVTILDKNKPILIRDLNDVQDVYIGNYLKCERYKFIASEEQTGVIFRSPWVDGYPLREFIGCGSLQTIVNTVMKPLKVDRVLNLGSE